MAAGTVHLPFYATIFRADSFEEALREIAPACLRYDANRYWIYRGGDDRYRFSVYFDFNAKSDWERFWYGPEFIAWRAKYTSWYQIPVVYDWGSTVEHGESEVLEPA